MVSGHLSSATMITSYDNVIRRNIDKMTVTNVTYNTEHTEIRPEPVSTADVLRASVMLTKS